jgi:threonine dehydrogenase-like Zn-dependent dehydrogenase
MRTIVLHLKIPRYLFSKAVGLFWEGIYYTNLSCLFLREVPEPCLPSEEWAKIRTIYSGICGSDLSGIFFRDRWNGVRTSYISFPIGLGHEIVGRIVETGTQVKGFATGERVVITPNLTCRVRGIAPPCRQCEQGNTSLCENFNKGKLAVGTTIGDNRDTGGGWGEYLVAHQSQLHKVPEGISDELAAFADPCACVIHAILKALPRDDDKVIVYGAGAVGLCLIKALRALGSKCHITAIGRYPYQAEKAKEFGADEALLDGRHIFEEVAAITGAEVVKSKFGWTKTLNGGADIIFECTVTSRTLDQSLRFCRGKGRVVLIGMAYPKNIDWSLVFFNEINILGSIGYADEDYNGKVVSAVEIALELFRQGKLDVSSLLTHTFEIADYKKAIKTHLDKRHTGQIKTLFYTK